jgi:hypothetical protein
VETEGLTARLPDASTVPTPLSIVTPVAFVELQESVVDCPFSIADGDALREIVADGGGGGGGGGGGALASTGAGAGGFFAHPIPEMSKASRIAAEVASKYTDFLIGSISFPCLWIFLTFVLITAPLGQRNMSNGTGVYHADHCEEINPPIKI